MPASHSGPSVVRCPLLAHVSIEQAANVWPLVPPKKSNAEMEIHDHNK